MRIAALTATLLLPMMAVACDEEMSPMNYDGEEGGDGDVEPPVTERGSEAFRDTVEAMDAASASLDCSPVVDAVSMTFGPDWSAAGELEAKLIVFGEEVAAATSAFETIDSNGGCAYFGVSDELYGECIEIATIIHRIDMGLPDCVYGVREPGDSDISRAFCVGLDCGYWPTMLKFESAKESIAMVPGMVEAFLADFCSGESADVCYQP